MPLSSAVAVRPYNYKMSSPGNFQCTECAAILRELMDARRMDAEKLREEWLATGRDLEELREWLLQSMANDDSFDVTKANQPRTAEVLGRKGKHEALTGHSVLMLGKRGRFRQNL
jgi:hypothetical protein